MVREGRQRDTERMPPIKVPESKMANLQIGVTQARGAFLDY